MSKRSIGVRGGVTLVEILVSLSLMAFLLTTATVAFAQVRAMTSRVQAKQVLHQNALVIYERLRFEISSLQQNSAMYLRSNGATGPVELVFLRGKLDDVDFTINDRFGSDVIVNTDLVWTRWAWSPDTKVVTNGFSSNERNFQITTNWTPGSVNYKDQIITQLPNPRRIAGTNPEITLEDNAFGSGDPNDYGDWGDLIRRSVPVATTCSDLRFEIVQMNNAVQTASVDGITNFAVDGLTVDGRLLPNNVKRPRLIRLRFDLTDESVHLTETFSFSFQPPGMLPQL